MNVIERGEKECATRGRLAFQGSMDVEAIDAEAAPGAARRASPKVFDSAAARKMEWIMAAARRLADTGNSFHGKVPYSKSWLQPLDVEAGVLHAPFPVLLRRPERCQAPPTSTKQSAVLSARSLARAPRGAPRAPPLKLRSITRGIGLQGINASNVSSQSPPLLRPNISTTSTWLARELAPKIRSVRRQDVWQVSAKHA
eukprot:6461317-Pyramimonas_sp.AAC.1